MSDSVELWLVRHGQTEWNVSQQLAGFSDIGLTDFGRKQAAALKPMLESSSFDSVHSSDLIRAVETARLAWGQCPADGRLREINFGELEGVHWQDVDPALVEALLVFRDFRAPGGEDLAVFQARVLGFISSLKPGRHLIFTHGGVIRTLTHDMGLDKFAKNGSLIKVDWTNHTLNSVYESDDPENRPPFSE